MKPKHILTGSIASMLLFNASIVQAGTDSITNVTTPEEAAVVENTFDSVIKVMENNYPEPNNQSYVAGGNIDVTMVSASSNATQTNTFGNITTNINYASNLSGENIGLPSVVTNMTDVSIGSGVGVNVGGSVIQAVNSSTAIAIYGNYNLGQ